MRTSWVLTNTTLLMEHVCQPVRIIGWLAMQFRFWPKKDADGD